MRLWGVVSSSSAKLATDKVNHIKTFDEIPGPRRFPVVGTLYQYKLPGWLGGHEMSRYHIALRDMHAKYGPLVREQRGDHALIHVFDPDDVKAVFSVEGKSPTIPPLQEATQFYRTKRELSLGLGNTNGDEWYRLRSAVHKMMLRPKEVSYYLPFVDKVAIDFMGRIEQECSKKDDRIVENLRELVGKWILESAGMICFEKRLGGFAENESLVEKMIAANKQIFIIAGELKLSLPLYKYFPTPRMKRFFDAEDFFYDHASKFIHETIQEIQNLAKLGKLDANRYNFLSYLLSRKELSEKDVAIITFSLFGDGLSTAKHPDVQERVFVEIERNLGKQGGIVTVDVLNKLSLLKAVVKEALRLYPNGTEVSRIIQTDLVLSNYMVPANTHVDLNQFVHFRSPQYFHDPDNFIPERWLRDEEVGESSKSVQNHPYLFIPFGHGTRMCAGRRFAEQDLHVGLTRMVQKYRLELADPSASQEMEQVYETLLFPKHPVRIKFMPR
ncbi:probable cytochrome P450 CYP44 isoform X2 [Folsomia candida]|uniref:probable cytochrome P450 CYP44 isoform X2 n=1 Tax=Folsomia candida TaxID=158441 RepID=UPI001605238A|nr:probable cytochrome P450 CYP44 isoform X2 [Folsomia candida]